MPENRRSSTRHSVNIDVSIEHEGETGTYSMVNLSLGGALIVYPQRLPLGIHLDISFRMPTLDEPIKTKAQVRWSSDEALGVQFDGLRAREVWSLNEFFKQFEK